MTPATLYELLGIPEDVPPEMVRTAALVDGVGAAPVARKAAMAVLSDPSARADYDARESQGLAFELALAWGVAALSRGDVATARDHFTRAERIAPDNAAMPILRAAIDSADPAEETPPTISQKLRDKARGEIDRVRHNSAFPHRLIRYAAALAGEPEEAEDPDHPMLAGAARELLQYDVAEAPRAYAMILPVLREHYESLYALDEPFFDATMSVIARHTPRAEYERGKQARRLFGEGPVNQAAEQVPGLEIPAVKLPPLRVQDRRLNIPNMGDLYARSFLARSGYSWAGAVLGAILAVEDGPVAMVGGAVIGFTIVYLVTLALRRGR